MATAAQGGEALFVRLRFAEAFVKRLYAMLRSGDIAAEQ